MLQTFLWFWGLWGEFWIFKCHGQGFFIIHIVKTGYWHRFQLSITAYSIQMQAGQWGFIEYRPPKKKTEYRPNIDHTALYRPNIDRKSSLKSAHLQYLLLSPEIYIFWENEAFREIWGISEDCFNWGHLGKHCIWTTWILMEYRPFWCNIDHKFKNIDHLSKMVDYRPMVYNIDPVAGLAM